MEKQNGKSISRRQLFAIWGTLITVLGTSVVPKIIDVLNDRPSITEVQDMIAEQTKALTVTVNLHTDRMEKLSSDYHRLDKSFARLSGLHEALGDIVGNCCTKQTKAVVRLAKPVVKRSIVIKRQQKLPKFNPAWIQKKAE